MKELLKEIQKFRDDRDWEQFHSPKNLAMALVVEAGEIAEHFQWMTTDESRTLSPEKKEEVGEEIADVLMYLVNLADKLGLDPMEAAYKKLQKNREKYPADRVRGKSKKYNEYDEHGT